jgi:hypothetical protein
MKEKQGQDAKSNTGRVPHEELSCVRGVEGDERGGAHEGKGREREMDLFDDGTEPESESLYTCKTVSKLGRVWYHN